MDPSVLPIAIVSFVLLFGLLLLGAPFYISFIAAAIPVYFWGAHVGFITLGDMTTNSVRAFTLIAIPLFICLGYIMTSCGATTLLYDIARTFVGHLPGGLGMASFVACAMFGTMCGSSCATALGVGAISVPEMEKDGYSKGLCAAIISSGGGLGLIIPPSIGLIILGSILRVSTADLFMAGFVPGIICTGFLSVGCYLRCRVKKDVKIAPHASWEERGMAVVRALPIILLPLSIIGSLWGGICTPTEAAGVAIVSAVFIARFYFHKFGWKEIKWCVANTAHLSASIYFLLFGCLIFGKAISYLYIPQMIGETMAGWGLELTSFRLVLVGIFLILGMFLDPFVLTLVILPTLLPVFALYPEIEFIPFGITFMLITNMAELTPPVGIVLYAGTTGTGANITDTIRELPPFYIAITAAILLTLFIPALASIY